MDIKRIDPIAKQSPARASRGSSRAAGADASSRLDDQLCFAVYSASHAMAKAYRPLLEPLGITYSQYLVMLVLWERDGVTVSELGERLGLDSGTLTPLLKRLESAGLVRRRRAIDDERRVHVDLSETGRELRQRARLVPSAMLARTGCTTAELFALRDRLHLLRASLETAPD